MCGRVCIHAWSHAKSPHTCVSFAVHLCVLAADVWGVIFPHAMKVARWKDEKKDFLSSSAQKIKFFSPVLFNLPNNNNNSNNNPLLLAASLLCSSVSMATAKLTTQSGADEDSHRGCRQSCSGAHLRKRRCHKRAERLSALSSLCYSVFLGGFDWSTFAQILQSCAPSLLYSALNLLWFWECRSADWNQCESALNISSFSSQKGMSPLLATTPLVSL